MTKDTRIERAREVLTHSLAEESAEGHEDVDARSALCYDMGKALAILSEPEPSASSRARQDYTEQHSPPPWNEPSAEESGEAWTCHCGYMNANPVICTKCGKSKPESGEREDRVLLWDKSLRSYVSGEGDERTHNYTEAREYPLSEAASVAENTTFIALADLSGWVESWGEQPVSDGVDVEIRLRNGSCHKTTGGSGRWTWAIESSALPITHFRLPLPVGPKKGTPDSTCDMCGKTRRPQCSRGLEGTYHHGPDDSDLEPCENIAHQFAPLTAASADLPTCACDEHYGTHHPECPAVAAWDERMRRIVREELAGKAGDRLVARALKEMAEAFSGQSKEPGGPLSPAAYLRLRIEGLEGGE